MLRTLRDSLQLTGTQSGCGQALCGACTVHLDGHPIRSCVTPVPAAEGRRLTTIEGSDADIDAAMAGDICRCGPSACIRAAIHDAAKSLA